VIGLGDIGRRTARLAQGFSMDVVVCTPRTVTAPGLVQVTLDELLAVADVVFVTVPLTEGTRDLVGRRELAQMRSTSYLVSIAPEEVLDLVALEDALRRGALAGAALDVVGSAAHLAEVPRLLVTRRWGIRTQDARARRVQTWVAALHEEVAAEPLRARP
jgi:phosphoglycerate dehydrogenase-like enzyme